MNKETVKLPCLKLFYYGKFSAFSMWKGGPTFCNLSGADFAGM